MSHSKIMADVLKLEAQALIMAAERIQALQIEEVDKLVELWQINRK